MRLEGDSEETRHGADHNNQRVLMFTEAGESHLIHVEHSEIVGVHLCPYALERNTFA